MVLNCLYIYKYISVLFLYTIGDRMRLNDTTCWCCVCNVQLAPMEGRILWDDDYFRNYCKPHATELLEARKQRKSKKKNAGITPMF